MQGWQPNPWQDLQLTRTDGSRVSGWTDTSSALQDMDKRKKLKQMEVLWRGSESYGSDADVFTGNFPAGEVGAG